MPYAELAVTTNFTFLTGASHPEEMVERAAELEGMCWSAAMELAKTDMGRGCGNGG